MWRVYKGMLFLILAGCGKREYNPGELVVIPGKGIPKVAELGMALKDIRTTIADLKVEPYPPVGLPWLRNSAATPFRLPWDKPQIMSAASDSIGVFFTAEDENKSVQSLVFYADPDNSSRRFRGHLSGGISFGGKRKVTRREITTVFGEPFFHESDLTFEVWELIQAGNSVSVKSNGLEHLYYPTNGIRFFLGQDQVVLFEIQQRVQRLAP